MATLQSLGVALSSSAVLSQNAGGLQQQQQCSSRARVCGGVGVVPLRGGRRRTAVRVPAVGAEAVESSEIAEAVKARREVQDKAGAEGKNFVIREVDCVGKQDWHGAIVTKVEEIAAGTRCITLTAECSRELVKIEAAYRKAGQLAQVRIGEEVLTGVTCSSSPFSNVVNDPVLYKIRGDIPAGTTKLPQYSLSAKAPLDLHVTEAESPALFNLKEGDEVELGPFSETGLDLRPIMFLTRYSTQLIFAQGRGIAVARALMECRDGDNGSLNLGLREDVRLYYAASSPSSLAYKDRFGLWEGKKAKVRTIVENTNGEAWDGPVGSLLTLWDEDDIEYDPMTTGVVVCVEKSRREEVKSLLAEAGVPEGQIVTWDVDI
ncbi:hypothetical protein R1flu_019173 [Riccia fluitans]|uniref:Uncharacterized protein n=1 Tax=Riccia fluitans TaxID=41844 RepID=A0ABD1ZHY2_9MARC